MATKPLTHEEIAKTEKKLDMPLDEIIKMSKNSTAKPNKQRRAPNKNQRMFNNSVQEKALKVQRYMASRPFVRQGALAQKRSNFQGNHFPIAKDFAQKAAVTPLRNRPFERNVMPNANKAREGSFMVRRRGENGAFTAKQPQSQQQQGDGVMKLRPQTLDAMFANMKEQRMRSLLQQNNTVRQNNGNGNGNGVRQNNWGQRNRNIGRIGVPWARHHFTN